MARGESKYAACKEVCSNLAQPGLALHVPRVVNYANRETTIDQARIEAILDTMELTDRTILHVGVGNSHLAARFAPRVHCIDGLTVSPEEKAQAETLHIPNYTVYVLNKYSRAFICTIRNTYDFIIDNNLASFSCCKYHFYLMLDNYLGSLKPGGYILTDQRGMDWSFNDPRWIFTYADLVQLEHALPIKVSRMSEMVYGLQALPVAPRADETLDVYTMIGANGDTPVQRRLC